MLLVRMRPLHWCAMMFAGYAALCAGQTGAPNNVSGAVVNLVTGEPIRRALVSVGQLLVFTGADGRFQAENVPEGLAVISARKPGYFGCAMEACDPDGSPATAMMTVRSGANEVLLKLVPESHIEGRIVDEDGEPVSNIQISAMGEHISDGLKQFRADNVAETNENGYYRIGRLLPGGYVLETTARLAFQFQSPESSAAAPEMYPRFFYPNAAERSAAQLLDLKPGQDLRADFTLKAVASVRITGSISPLLPGLSVRALDSNGEETPLHLRFSPETGKFAAFVPEGTWVLRFGSATPEGENYTAMETVTTNSSSIDNLRIVLQPLATVLVAISGHSSEDGEQQAAVLLVSKEAAGKGEAFSSHSIQKTSQRANAISDVFPGRYGVLVTAANECVDSVNSGEVDLTENDLVVLPGSQTQAIKVALRSDCASLQLAANSEGRDARATVILIPSSRVAVPSMIPLGPGGTVTMSSLSPGDYGVYAFSNVEGLEYANPEAMSEFSGRQLTLTANEHATITVDVISRNNK